MRNIKIIDNNAERYTIKASTNILGRRYDNIAETLKVEIPQKEIGRVCTMIVTANGNVIDHINVTEEPIPITSNLSQYKHIQIGFSFSDATGYIKNSKIEMFSFLDAQKPDDFLPIPPEQSGNIDALIGLGFADVRRKVGHPNTLEFRNVLGNIVKEIELSNFVQEQADLGETNEQMGTFVRGKKTSNLLNDGDGESPFITREESRNKLEALGKELKTAEHRLDSTEDSVLQLELSKQDKLIAGNKIEIDENNTISVVEDKINTFAESTWLEIDDALSLGKTKEYYHTGDIKRDKLKTGKEVDFVILGSEHDKLTEGGIAELTIGMIGCLDDSFLMNSTATNIGGWNDCKMRNVTMQEIYDILPVGLQKIIRPVDKKSSAGGTSTEIITSSDKLWLLCEEEITGYKVYGTGNEGYQYEYWKTVKDGTLTTDRIKYKSNGVATWWWLRSPYRSGSSHFCVINSEGEVNINGANLDRGVSVVFCIGKKQNYLTEETDPTVPQYVKDITKEDIARWNKVNELQQQIQELKQLIT